MKYVACYIGSGEPVIHSFGIGDTPHEALSNYLNHEFNNQFEFAMDGAMFEVGIYEAEKFTSGKPSDSCERFSLGRELGELTITYPV